jgi:hypothetical protein
MATRANVEILHEVRSGEPGNWNLCFQWVRYHYTDGSGPEMGYRFIWRRPDNSLQAAMGQARIPCASDIFHLLQLATCEGWFVVAEKTRDDEV